MMKHAKFLILPFIFLLLNSCKQIDKLTQFTIPYETQVSIPSNSVVSLPFDLYSPDIESNSSSQFENNNTNADLVEKILLNEMKSLVVSPTSGDFSFLKDIEIYLSADGVAETKIAWKYDIPDNVGNELTLDVTDADLKDFIKASSFKMRVKTTTDKIITQDYQIKVNAVFWVDAKILGV